MTTSILGSTTPTGGTANHDSTGLTLGVRFSSAVDGYILGVRAYGPDSIASNPGTPTWGIWNSSGSSLLTSGTLPAWGSSSWFETAWNEFSIAPFAVTAGVQYVVGIGVFTTFAVTSHGYDSPIVSGDLTAPIGAGSFHEAGSFGYPADVFNNNNYFVDVLFDTSIPVVPTLTGYWGMCL